MGEDKDGAKVMKRNNKSAKSGTQKTWENPILKNKIKTNIFFQLKILLLKD